VRPSAARAQSDADPAISSRRQALRVLLGHGEAITSGPETFSYDGRPYRGTFERDPGGAVVNVVDLEAYLASVVSREMPPSWPPAALQTQAICARTYVLQRSDPRRSYDLVPSELDQVYDGVAGETPGGAAAVAATAGGVLKYGVEFARVAYSSCCGGHTESAADAWGNQSLPYLSGVVCPWCQDSPNYRWSRTLGFDAMAARFAASLPPAGALQDLRVTGRDASGRARAFELVTSAGDAIVSGSTFRQTIGARVLPSLLVTGLARSPEGDGVVVDGGGLGHGVGLCQWGARGMALSGAGAGQIAAFYFPGTIVDYLE